MRNLLKQLQEAKLKPAEIKRNIWIANLMLQSAEKSIVNNRVEGMKELTAALSTIYGTIEGMGPEYKKAAKLIEKGVLELVRLTPEE